MAQSALMKFTCRNVACPRRDQPVTRFVTLGDTGQPSTPVLTCSSCGREITGEPA